MQGGEWTFCDSPNLPVDAGKKFVEKGRFQNLTYLTALMRFPTEYLVKARSKKLSAEERAFVLWVQSNYQVDPTTAHVVRKDVSAQRAPGKCECKNVHHKGSSSRYIRSTCKDCGRIWETERHKPTLDPATCPHANVDHRGSNARVHKTFCIDCGTYVESIS